MNNDELLSMIRAGDWMKLTNYRHLITQELLLYILENGANLMFVYMCPMRLDDSTVLLLYNKAVELNNKYLINYLKVYLPKQF